MRARGGWFAATVLWAVAASAIGATLLDTKIAFSSDLASPGGQRYGQELCMEFRRLPWSARHPRWS